MEKKKPIFNKIKGHRLRWILTVFFTLFLITGIFFYWQVDEYIERTVIERVKAQELTLARAGALFITDFFQDKKPELLLIAKIESVKSGEEKEGRNQLKLLAEKFYESGFLTDVVRVDKDGKVIWSINIKDNPEGEGVLVDDRDYFNWAKEQEEAGEIFINKPLIARGGLFKGNWTVGMTTSIFYQGKFNGLILVSFPIKELTGKYITSLGSSSTFQSSVINQDGTIIASTNLELAEKNTVELIQQEKWKDKEKVFQATKRALSGDEVSIIHYYPIPENLSSKKTKVISVYSPIKINGILWSLWVYIPYQEALGYVSPLKKVLSLGFVFCAVSALILIFLFIFGVRIAQGESFKNGFKKGCDG